MNGGKEPKPAMSSVTQFTNIIVRQPSPAAVNGLRDVDQGNPDYPALELEHSTYIDAMKAAGIDVTILPSLRGYPDSIFVEDPALVFKQGAILLRPGAPSRLGESTEIEKTLGDLFDVVIALPEPGFVEGGDVLLTPDKVMIGLSERTDLPGAEALVKCLSALGRKGEIVQTPADVLHFKTDCSLLDDETVFTTRRLAASGVFDGFNTFFVPDGEEAAANALRVNDVVMVGADFPKSIELLDKLGYKTVPIPTTEIGKIDAGLSCMSLRW
jgi:dimethylargininase